MPPNTPGLQHISFTDVDGIIEAIYSDGAVIATDYTDLETLHKVTCEIAPWLEQSDSVEKPIYPNETHRCPRLVGRSPTARQRWLTRPQLTTIVNHFLCKATTGFYNDVPTTSTTYPTLSLSLTMDIRPGSKSQPLHRDDVKYHIDHRDQTESGYQRGSDVMMGVLCPGVETTVENGATLVIPGSHLWDDGRAPSRDKVVYATMQPGEALIFLGSLYHAGGANRTVNSRRPVHSMFFCRGTHRQEENQYLAYTSKEVLGWSEEVQRLVGFDVSSPNLGYVDFVSPAQFMKGYGGLLQ